MNPIKSGMFIPTIIVAGMIVVALVMVSQHWANHGNRTMSESKQSDGMSRANDGACHCHQMENRSDEMNAGTYRGPGLSIVFAGTSGEGTTVADVINATIHRMEFEQGSDMASDQNARAMVLLLQAKSVLAGTDAETEDGIPVIE